MNEKQLQQVKHVIFEGLWCLCRFDGIFVFRQFGWLLLQSVCLKTVFHRQTELFSTTGHNKHENTTNVTSETSFEPSVLLVGNVHFVVIIKLPVTIRQHNFLASNSVQADVLIVLLALFSLHARDRWTYHIQFSLHFFCHFWHNERVSNCVQDSVEID